MRREKAAAVPKTCRVSWADASASDMAQQGMRLAAWTAPGLGGVLRLQCATLSARAALKTSAWKVYLAVGSDSFIALCSGAHAGPFR